MLQSKNERLTVAGMMIAVGIILPFATSHGFGIPGTVLLPMHIPVFLCGFLCGPSYGLLCGFLLPILNAVLTGMPSFYPMMPIMAFELLTYGCVSGALYRYTKKLYLSMLIAMIGGRIMYGLVFAFLFVIKGTGKALTVWGAIATGIPGIVIQLLLVPAIVLLVKRTLYGRREYVITSAKHLLSEDTATCVVIVDNTIVKTQYGRGIAPILSLYESDILKDAYVVDKIIGKAAAMILTLGGVKGIYAKVISQPALVWLETQKIEVTYEKCVDRIMNRAGDGMCPMEQTVQDIDDAKEALLAVKEKISQLKGEQS